jgi:geranylgeranylglycerol-phosphate geranylgeranyltransferase
MVPGFCSLIRPGNCAISGAAVLISYMIVSDISSAGILATIVAALIVAGGNSLNDYFDRKIDCISHPNRPIPSRKVSPEQALTFAILCFISGMILSTTINYECFLLTLLNTGILVLYEKRWKSGLSAIFCISYLLSSLFLFGGLAAGNPGKLWAISLLAFLANSGREILKDVCDMDADLLERETFPMKAGVRKAKIIASIFIFSAVLLSPLPYFTGLSGYYLLFIGGADIIFLYSILLSFRNTEGSTQTIKGGMVVALIAIFLGR